MVSMPAGVAPGVPPDSAIADDIGAVGLIGIPFSENLQALLGAGAALLFMTALGRWRSAPFRFYAVGFALAWAFTLEERGPDLGGVGVLAAFTVLVGPSRTCAESVLHFFMESLHPYVAYGIPPAPPSRRRGAVRRD